MAKCLSMQFVVALQWAIIGDFPFFRSPCWRMQPGCSGTTWDIVCTSRGQSVFVLCGPALWRHLDRKVDADKFNKWKSKCEAPSDQCDALSQSNSTHFKFPECQTIRRRFLWMQCKMGPRWYWSGTFQVCERHCRYVRPNVCRCLLVCMCLYVQCWISCSRKSKDYKNPLK